VRAESELELRIASHDVELGAEVGVAAARSRRPEYEPDVTAAIIPALGVAAVGEAVAKFSARLRARRRAPTRQSRRKLEE
jgi:hypothetical protein